MRCCMQCAPYDIRCCMQRPTCNVRCCMQHRACRAARCIGWRSHVNIFAFARKMPRVDLCLDRVALAQQLHPQRGPSVKASHCSYSACDRSLGRFLCAAQSRSTLRSARRCRRRMRFRRLCCAASISAEHPQRYVSKARPHARECACVCTRVRERARVLRARARVWSGRRAGGRAGNAG